MTRYLARPLTALALACSLWGVAATASADDSSKSKSLPEVPISVLVPIAGAVLYGVRVFRLRKS